jgi:hypothetical protein
MRFRFYNNHCLHLWSSHLPHGLCKCALLSLAGSNSQCINMASVEDYTIGCICALPLEAVALRAFLDEEHDCPDIPSTHAATQDRNVYTTGAIGGHKIVVGTLPFGRYGVSQATGVIENMIRSFPNLRCCLMVGIGGGAPSSRSDIRLGDVVVSDAILQVSSINWYKYMI